MALQRQELVDGGILYFDERGTLQSHRLGSGVLLHTRSGVIHGEFANIVRADCDEQMRDFGRCILMVDAVLTRMHTTDFREVMTTWFETHVEAEVHVLTQSSMVRMAVTVANMSSDKVHALSYESETLWLAVGRRHLANFRRRPLSTPQA